MDVRLIATNTAVFLEQLRSSPELRDAIMVDSENRNSIAPKGRGAAIRPNNRFESVRIENELEYLEHDDDAVNEMRAVRTQYYPDQSESIVSTNNSPDIYFNYSINPYRGCAHGCSYCYARPTHEYLGMDGGIDFETKILVKLNAAALLRDWLNRPSWKCEPIVFSGVTDCYQQAERRFTLTRQCLEVALEARQPVEIITKNALITRDLDLLSELAALNLTRVALSITSLDQELTKRLEPRTSSPDARLGAITKLADAGVPTAVMVAPTIPGLNDSEVPGILERARDAGATNASYVLLRLPHSVEPVFLEWLARHQPLKQEKVISMIRQTREGSLYDADFSQRMNGRGAIAAQIAQTFKVFAAKYELNRAAQLDCSQFRPPVSSSGQMRLF